MSKRYFQDGDYVRVLTLPHLPVGEVDEIIVLDSGDERVGVTLFESDQECCEVSHEDLELLSSIAEGHNPEQFTAERVGCHKGWRLLAKTELSDLPVNGGVECYHDFDGEWMQVDTAGRDGVSYRTLMPQGHYEFRDARPVEPSRPSVPRNDQELAHALIPWLEKISEGKRLMAILPGGSITTVTGVHDLISYINTGDIIQVKYD